VQVGRLADLRLEKGTLWVRLRRVEVSSTLMSRDNISLVQEMLLRLRAGASHHLFVRLRNELRVCSRVLGVVILVEVKRFTEGMVCVLSGLRMLIHVVPIVRCSHRHVQVLLVVRLDLQVTAASSALANALSRPACSCTDVPLLLLVARIRRVEILSHVEVLHTVSR